MPNWCNTSLVFKGDKQEIKTLYQTMKRLERRKKPLVENGFGTNWLGCLVEALGGHWKETYCRGTWFFWNVKGIFCVWKPKLLGHPASKHTTSSVKNFRH